MATGSVFFPLPPRSAPMMPGRGAWRRCRRRKWRKALESGLGEAEVAEVDGGGGSERFGLGLTLAVLVVLFLPNIRRKREEVFVED